MRSNPRNVFLAAMVCGGLGAVTSQAAVITGVGVSGTAPSANVALINDSPVTSRSSWALTSATDGNAELGQTFSVTADVAIAAIAFQLSDLFSIDTNQGPARNANSQAFSLVIDVMNPTLDAADVAPASQVATFTGTTPADFDNSAPDAWVTLNFDSAVNLTAGVQYGFRLVWSSPVDGRLVSLKHTGSTGTTNTYTGGLAYRFSESTGTYVAIGTLGHSRDLNFALKTVPEPASAGLLALGSLLLARRRK